ncbi:MAG TPA: hypothetical protein VHL78_09530 [Actinomycetota bacterium]|nr:hypothetical protein [Actinomycetota bacterium]
MSDPIVFISHSRVKEGKLDGFKRYFGEGTLLLEQGKPRTVAFLAYGSDEGDEVTIVHVFPDAEAMALHMEGVRERAAAAYEFIESKGFEIYGPAPEQIVGMMRRAATEGVTVTVHRDHLGGFLRLRAG